MGKRRKSKASDVGRLTKTVFCPECGTMCRKVTSKPHQHDVDESGRMRVEDGKYVLVTRVFYGCPNGNCGTVIWFNYREDGKPGREYIKQKMLEAGLTPRPDTLTGSFGGIE